VRARPGASYIGITGTNGKSTTTALIGHILETVGMPSAVGGNLGLPALSLDALGPSGVYVLEMSSYQLELTPSVQFDVAILLNISPDHLDRHGGMEGYIAAKRRMFEQQTAGGTAIIGIDDADAKGLFDRLTADRPKGMVPISSENPVDGGVYASGPILIDATGRTAETVRSLEGIETLPGAHNAQNAAAAYAAARAIGIPAAAIAAALESYPGLPHRQQLAAVIDGVRYVNDSKATNPEAAAKALSSYHDIYWIAGGRAKEGTLEVLYPFLPSVRRAYLIGEAADRLGGELEGRVEIEYCGDLDSALEAASQAATGHEAVVLLSPACASFDQFASFEERGQVFCRLAAELPGGLRDIRCDGEAA
jgi:UDP-N-acetylmuramoylalanine--D-glutamate ligase